MIKLIILIMIVAAAANEKTCPERNIDCRIVRCRNIKECGSNEKLLEGDGICQCCNQCVPKDGC
ncbi:unnamed protein product [Larinioides sclopetarius]|uniref:Uncharacterized protein n=1 Tax=Larinioides sclopetarius TaxID=280406 RepID=A0AAV1ZXI4_9ARAC